ncbi:translation initiation factor IF-2 N-terminal domain-containing protein, partial [Knoellia subterranea]|uniref:translation initiation factor IF-2 N-terminal domain-containing protein n=1 Tax=Knoellia subterranea TaxID=184882 RepID=UPI001B80B315
MAKVRVSALAKEVGVTSKVLLERLNEMGEYVKSASSTIEAPVVRRYQEKFPVDTPAPAEAKPAAKKAPAKAAPAPAAPSAPGEKAATPGPKAPAAKAAPAPAAPAPAAPAPAAPAAKAT